MAIRLGPDESKAMKQSKVLQLLEDTGLQAKAADYVGGDLPGGLSLRGLSGGEKRRLSLVSQVDPMSLCGILVFGGRS